MTDFLEIKAILGKVVRRSLTAIATLSLVLMVGAGAAVPATAHAADTGDGRYLDPVFSALNIQYNLVYGQAVSESGQLTTLKLDLYQPVGDNARTRPVVIFAHGGAFKKGDKGEPRNVAIADLLARRGWVTASINFRTDGVEQHATDDMQAAVRWFRAHAGYYRIDPEKIVVMGPSSGAVSALHTNFDPEDPGNSGNPGYPSNVAGAVSVSGTVQDPSIIGPGEPPIAMFHALDDTVIPYALGEATCLDTTAMGNVCEMFTYPEGGHPPNFLINNRAQILEQTSDFLCRQVLGVDAQGYTCDPDDDNDGVADGVDACPAGATDWPSGQTTDYDGDGCKDDTEDPDDDNDGVVDSADACPRTITGTPGNDTISGTPGPDVIDAGAGDDVIYGLDGNDTVCGGNGNDILRGSSGNDNLNGGAGNDIFYESVGANGADTFSGGPGTDVADYSARSATLTVTINDLANDGQAGEADNVKTDVEDLVGGSSGDSLTTSGSTSANRLVGQGGNDALNVVDGISGNDTIDGGADTDSCTADAGDANLSCP
jgi:Ca2+-binding RTX toxin-like protein